MLLLTPWAGGGGNLAVGHLNKVSSKFFPSMYAWRHLCGYLSDKCQRWEESRMENKFSVWETPAGFLFCSFSIQEN